MACLLGHTWDGCTCTQCGEIRDEQHEWFTDCVLAQGELSEAFLWGGGKMEEITYCTKCGKHK